MFIPRNRDELFLAAISAATLVAFISLATRRCLYQFDSNRRRGVIVQMINTLGRDRVVPRLQGRRQVYRSIWQG